MSKDQIVLVRQIIMDKRTKTGILIALAAVLAVCCIISESFSSPNTKRASFVFQTMGTTASFTFEDTNAEVFQKDCSAGRQQFERILQTSNLYNRNSEVVRLNNSAYEKDFICSDLLWQMILEAEKAYHFTGGAFDITVKPLMDVWGFYRKKGKIPDDREIKEALKKVGFNKLSLDKKRKALRFTVPGMALDLGGIAKGFALDLAAENISHSGRGVLNLGGNLKFLGGRKNYHVGIKDPSSPGKLSNHTFEAAPGSAVSTSGDYERYVKFNGKTYGHIIDPVTGYPVSGKFSATVVISSAACADWLSTAVFLRGESLAEKAQRNFAGCRVILVKK